MNHQRRILFVSENVTLAQVVRLATLARSLDPERYEVHFASAGFPELIFGGTEFIQHHIETLPAEDAARALESGKRLYEKSTLLKYIEAERELIERVQPALVVGDFRLSLSTSAEVCHVPSAVLINAYWSPFAVRERFPVPDHPIIKVLGERLTEQYFPRAIPQVFQHFANPLNAARRKHGLSPVGSLLEMLTHGSYVLHPDDCELTPVAGAPSHHRFLGPVLWEPSVAAPQLPLEHPEWPLVYVTLGSSGKADVLPTVVDALAGLQVRAVVATADRVTLPALPANIVQTPFAPGSRLAARSSLVITNGGSTTGYQALAAGTPVVGIPSNFDQYLASQAIVTAGAGLEVKARLATVTTLRSAVRTALDSDALRESAAAIGRRFASADSSMRFREWLAETVG